MRPSSGYFGDRLGRKKTLIATLLIMAVATVTVGLVPSTASIGMAAPLILVALRLLQGFAVGGEWAGSALLSAEYAPAGKRGLYGMFTLLGGGTAGGAEQPDLSRRELHHRRKQPRVHAVGLAHCRS